MWQRELWWTDFNRKPNSAEVKKTRPSIVISGDEFNQIPNGFVFVAPLTSKEKGYLYHIKIHDLALPKPSWCMVEQSKSIDSKFLIKRIGKIDLATFEQIRMTLNLILEMSK